MTSHKPKSRPRPSSQARTAAKARTIYATRSGNHIVANTYKGYLSAEEPSSIFCAALLPLSPPAARRACKFANLSEDEKLERLAEVIHGPYLKWKGKGKYGDSARSVLAHRIGQDEQRWQE